MPNQMTILNALRRCAQNGQDMPTMQELAYKFGIAKGTVAGHVQRLEKAGHLTRVKGSKRGIQLADEKTVRLQRENAELHGRVIGLRHDLSEQKEWRERLIDENAALRKKNEKLVADFERWMKEFLKIK